LAKKTNRGIDSVVFNMRPTPPVTQKNRENFMIAEFSIIPIGTEESLGEFVSLILKKVEASELPYSLNAMGTVVEGEWDEVMALIKECRAEALEVTARVFVNIAIDDRPGKPMDRMTEKVRSVEKRLGGKLKK